MQAIPMLRATVLALLLVPARSAGAADGDFQRRCERMLPPTTHVVKAEAAGHVVDNRFSHLALTAMGRPAAPGAQVLGLTRLDYGALVQTRIRVLDDPASGYECLAGEIEVVLRYHPMKVYVGREFPPGSCAHAEILGHEMRHVRTYLDFLPDAERAIRAALAKRFGGAPFYAPRGTGRRLLEREVSASWMPLVRAELAKVEARQALIDTPSEYERLGRACGGEVRRLAAGATR